MDNLPTNRKVLCDIARCAFGVVNGLLERDQRFARELRSDTTGSRQIVREESITVEMATTLKERFPAHVEITVFTAPEETRVGADWYWRIEKADRAVHARVQAKRVRRDRFGQPDEDGRIDIDAAQLRILIEATRSASTTIPSLQAWLAIYARCNATPPCAGPTEICARHRHEGSCAEHGPSVWIAQASEVERLRATRLTVGQAVSESLRLDCILPCIDDSSGFAPGPVNKGFGLARGLPTYEACVATIRGSQELRDGFAGAMRITV